MKNKKKVIIISILSVLLVITLILVTLVILKDENKLTVEEKQWINKNISNIQNLNVINDIDIVGKDGTGVFYDFISSIKDEYNITINPITYTSNDDLPARSFKIVKEVNDSHLIFKEEHFVLIGKSNTNISSLNNIKINLLKSDESLVKQYINNKTITFTTYDDYKTLYESLNNSESVVYLMVPLDEQLTTILSNNYDIIMHFSDIKKYFVYEQDNDIFSSIIKKYFNKYQQEKLDKSIDENTLKTFTAALNISEKDLSAIQAKEYNYGFINNSPYEVLSSGNYGGIVSEYIKRFSDVTKTEFKFTKYKNDELFKQALNKNNIDIYYNYYNFDTNYNTVSNGINIAYDILTKENDNMVINSIESLRNKTVYVKSNSLLSTYLADLGFLDVKTYKNDKELKKVLKNNNIIIVDHQIYSYNKDDLFVGYNSKYNNTIDEKYNFKIKDNDAFYNLFNKFISTLDNKEIINTGIYNHIVTVKNGSIIGKIAKYSLFIIIVVIAIIVIAYRSSKKIKIVKKIKKEDKIRYIDQLTSLKNRNYLTENIEAWNKNTVYPQTTIVIDLDNLQNINDTKGYEAGDEQIKAAANILIKTQLDNSDIVRTDGNEFLIYLVSYPEKQIVSYIRKLYKEFKNLPHEYGATIGYSMILDDIKTIEDAINEAVDDMKNKKEE